MGLGRKHSESHHTFFLPLPTKHPLKSFSSSFFFFFFFFFNFYLFISSLKFTLPNTILENLLVYSYSKKFIVHAKGIDVVARVSEDWLIKGLVIRFYKVQGMPNVHPWIRIETFGFWIFRRMVTLSFVIAGELNNLILCFSKKEKKKKKSSFVTILGYTLTKPAFLCPIRAK